MFLHMSTPFILDTQLKVNRVAQQLATIKTPITSSLLTIEAVCLAIKISDLLVDGKTDSEDLYANITETVPAIILSNYALVHFCLFKATKNCNALNGAIRLFHMSSKVLCIREKLQIILIDNLHADHDDKFMYFTEGSMFVSLVISLYMQYLPIDSAIKCCSASSTSFPMSWNASSCDMLQDLYTLRRFAGDWIISTSYQVTVAICNVSTHGTCAATAA